MNRVKGLFETWDKAYWREANAKGNFSPLYLTYGWTVWEAAFNAGLSAGEARGYAAGVEAAATKVLAVKLTDVDNFPYSGREVKNACVAGLHSLTPSVDRSLNSPAETGEGKRKAMTPLEEVVSMCKASVILDVNGHRNDYQSIDDFLETAGDVLSSEVEPSTIDEMRRTDTVYRLQFYPDTPIGFHVLYDSQPPRLLERALAILRKERGS